MTEHWYKDGLRFECTQCAECCKTHGEEADYAYVYLAPKDVINIAKFLGLTEEEFLGTHCYVDDSFPYLRSTTGDCLFLEKDGKCSIYPVRPKQCATWPFWTENLQKEIWNGDVKRCCPGIGKGRLYTAEEIEEIALDRDKWYFKVD